MVQCTVDCGGDHAHEHTSEPVAFPVAPSRKPPSLLREAIPAQTENLRPLFGLANGGGDVSESSAPQRFPHQTAFKRASGFNGLTCHTFLCPSITEECCTNVAERMLIATISSNSLRCFCAQAQLAAHRKHGSEWETGCPESFQQAILLEYHCLA